MNSYGCTVSNSILRCANSRGIKITPLKLNCLVYLVYSYYTCAYPNHSNVFRFGKLFDESFIKTALGPVAPTNDFFFSSFGADPISCYAVNAEGTVIFNDDEKFNASLSRVFEAYGDEDDISLLGVIEAGKRYSRLENGDTITVNDIAADEWLRKSARVGLYSYSKRLL